VLRDDITNVNFRLRNVENTDMGDLFKWRNHPDIRKNSFNTDTLLWVEHERWFKEKSKDPNSKIYVACYEDEKIGMVRFDEKDDVIKVSVMLNP
jgi:spore coat polysaccharide biosynthesis protein SpsF